jgi:ubiquinone/menaquinone biosynthesis C-methylase UbiE
MRKLIDVIDYKVTKYTILFDKDRVHMDFNNGSHAWLKLLHLAKKRFDSPEAYRDFQQYQGELLVKFIQSHNLIIEGKLVLDLGCGLGGYSLALHEHGAKVISADISPIDFTNPFQMLNADAQRLPLDANSMDLVICASLIEHIPEPLTLLREIHRVLRANGLVYLSFPPFYTPIGGHHFSPFHLLGERIALKMNWTRTLFRNRQWLQERYPEIPGSYALAFGDWGLYPLTISRVEKLLHELPFQVIERSTRWSPLDFSSIPLLRELITWHVQFLLLKNGS